MKEYKYKFSYYLVSILGPLLMMVGMLIWGIMGRLSGHGTEIHKLVTFVVPILLLSSLVALNQPSMVTDDDETVTFYAFGHKHEYKWAEIKFLRIRKFIMTDKLLLRIGNDRVLGGRYWIDMDSMPGSQELLKKLATYDPVFDINNTSGNKRKKQQERIKK